MESAEMTLEVPLTRKPSARALPIFADLILIKRDLKKGLIIGVRGGTVDRVFKLAEKTTGERFGGLAYVKDAGHDGTYHICAKSDWWFLCWVEAAMRSRTSRANKTLTVNRTLGKFCGFPPCCIEAYCRTPKPLTRFLAQPGSSALHIRKARDGYDQGSVVSWIPCSPTCSATWDYVRRTRRVLSRYKALRKMPWPDRRAVPGTGS